MIESSNFKTILTIPAEKDAKKKNVINIITFLSEPESLLNFLKPSSNNDVIVQKTSHAGDLQVKKYIYVCTFCQIFSPSETAIAAHITAEHETSLPRGRKAEEFISQLQALPNENDKKRKNKGGRPRKKENLAVTEETPTPPLVLKPVPGPDGLYWCQKCHRHFKQPRQLSRHVCLEITSENGTSCESTDSDSSDFKTYMDIEPTPWLRRPKHRAKSNKESSQISYHLQSDETLCEPNLPKSEDSPNNMKTFWRDDPNYVQLFENDSERFAFEDHLKSIDYSCVDSLFVKSDNKSKKIKKRKRAYITSYSCIVCQKEFRSLFHIRMHCLTHTDVKPFTCPKCPYRSNTKGSLYSHMRNHTGNLFHCSLCSFKTVKRSHLLEHEQTHSTVTQLCKLCKNTYKTVKSLIAHVHRYHNNPGGKKYAKFLSGKPSKDSFIKCNTCQKKFKTQTAFSTHTHTVVAKPAITQSSREIIPRSPSTTASTPAIAECSPENTQNSPTTTTSTILECSHESTQNSPTTATSTILECSHENTQNSPTTATSTVLNCSHENTQNSSTTATSTISECSPENTRKSPTTATSTILECSHENTQNSPTAVTSTSTILEYSHESIQSALSSGIIHEQLSTMSDNNIEYTNGIQTYKDPLDKIVWNDLLQQKNTEMYQNVFQPRSNPHIQTESQGLSNVFIAESSSRKLSQLEVDNQFHASNTVLEECQKRLGIDLLNECLRDTTFAGQVMAETCAQSSKLANASKSFGLHNIQIGYPNESIISHNINDSSNLSESLSHLDSELHKNVSTDFVSSESKSAETKLFEKCRQTPAYVCCVCSAIYVCTATLKIHLKEHINTQNSLMEQDNEDLEMSEADATIDSVCEMLEDSDNERELEKLYMSSLDLMYYLPEVSVLLENDSKFIDLVLDDISNFPMSDKYDESEFTNEM